MQNDPHVVKGAAHEFMTCGCEKGEHDVHEGCCMPPEKSLGIVGKRWATPLSGFIAGVIAASLILVPWMIILGRVW